MQITRLHKEKEHVEVEFIVSLSYCFYRKHFILVIITNFVCHSLIFLYLVECIHCGNRSGVWSLYEKCWIIYIDYILNSRLAPYLLKMELVKKLSLRFQPLWKPTRHFTQILMGVTLSKGYTAWLQFLTISCPVS